MQRLLIYFAVGLGLLFGTLGPTPASAYYHGYRGYHYGYRYGVRPYYGYRHGYRRCWWHNGHRHCRWY
jgi:hypothetical protein